MDQRRETQLGLCIMLINLWEKLAVFVIQEHLLLFLFLLRRLREIGGTWKLNSLLNILIYSWMLHGTFSSFIRERAAVYNNKFYCVYLYLNKLLRTIWNRNIWLTNLLIFIVTLNHCINTSARVSIPNWLFSRG